MAGSSPIRKLSPPMKHLYSIQLFLFEPENLTKQRNGINLQPCAEDWFLFSL